MQPETTTFETLVYRVGSLHALLRRLQITNECQGEHVVAYSAPDGSAWTLYVHVDGTDLEMHAEAGNKTGLSGNAAAIQDND